MPKMLIEIDTDGQVVVPLGLIKNLEQKVLSADLRIFAAAQAVINNATAPKQAQPAPIPTAWQPIETAPTDVLHVRGVVVCSANGIPTHFECHAGYVDRDGDFIDTAGDWNGWSAEDYTHWHPLAGPPAPGGSDE